MGIFDWLPCCGPRSREEKDTASTAEQATLLPPQREESILSVDGGYGAIDNAPAPQGGLTGEQRARIEEIGREVGNSMLPIHNSSHRSPHLHKPRINTNIAVDPSVPSSTASSRPSSPSPMRPGSSPPGGVMTPPHSENGSTAGAATLAPGPGVEGEGGEGDVVQKRLFVNAGRGRGGKRGRGRGKGKGRK